MALPRLKCFKVTKSAFRSFAALAYGMTMGMLGPCIPSLCARQGVSMEQLGWVLSTSYIFMMVASVAQGVILGRIVPRRYHDHYLSGVYIIMAVTTAIKSSTSSFWLFAVAQNTEFMAYTATDIVLIMNMFDMWGKNADPGIQALNFAWALGFAIGPIVVRAFFPDDTGPGTSLTTLNINNITSLNRSGTDGINTVYDASQYSALYGEVVHNDSASVLHAVDYFNSHGTNVTSEPLIVAFSSIEKPYTIMSVIMLLIAVVNIYYICKGQKYLKERSSKPQLVHTQSKRFVVTMCVFFVLYYFCIGGMENTFHTWIFSFAMSADLDFKEKEAALLDSTTKFVLMGSKSLSVALSFFVPCQVFLMSSILGQLGCVIALVLISTRSKVHLWVLGCLLNVFIAPLWGLGTIWMDKYIKMTPSILGLIYIGVGTSGLLFNALSGYIMTHADPVYLTYVLLAASGLVVLVVVTMQIRGSCHGNRFTLAVVDCEQDSEEKEKH